MILIQLHLNKIYKERLIILILNYNKKYNNKYNNNNNL